MNWKQFAAYDHLGYIKASFLATKLNQTIYFPNCLCLM